MTDQEPHWRIGELARSSGLSKRTLRYWDSIGLLCPSGRTSGGHREYNAGDLLRLYQVLGLRSLGLTLESIATCLDGGAEPRRIVSDQRAEVERRLGELSALRDRLEQIEHSIDNHASVSPELLLEVVRGIQGPSTPAMRTHLDPGQIETLHTAAAAAGPSAYYMLEVEWPQLYRQAERLFDADTSPGDPAVLRLVRRLDQLSAQFSGDDEISNRIRSLYLDDPAAVSAATDRSREHWQGLLAFLDEARALRAQGRAE